MYPNRDAIFERLETTKQFGLLSDYLVRWTGRSGRLQARVTVWGRAGTPFHVVRHYIARLLKGLVLRFPLLSTNKIKAGARQPYCSS
jgi:hypothetical protein